MGCTDTQPHTLTHFLHTNASHTNTHTSPCHTCLLPPHSTTLFPPVSVPLTLETHAHLDITLVFADINCLLRVCQHVDLNHPVSIVLYVKINVGEQVVLELRLACLGDDLLNLL